jgi:hypothetical protein
MYFGQIRGLHPQQATTFSHGSPLSRHASALVVTDSLIILATVITKITIYINLAKKSIVSLSPTFFQSVFLMAATEQAVVYKVDRKGSLTNSEQVH